MKYLLTLALLLITVTANASGPFLLAGILKPATAPVTWTDTFPGTSLNARWTAYTAGTGAATINNGATIASTGTSVGDAAAIALNSAVDTTVTSQYKFKLRNSSLTGETDGWANIVLYPTTPPGVADATTYAGRAITMYIGGNAGGSTVDLSFEYHSTTDWVYLSTVGTSGSWGGTQGSWPLNKGQDYVVTFDFTATTWRITVKDATDTTLIAQTPVTNWSTVYNNATNSYHFVVGEPLNDYRYPRVYITSAARTL